MTEREMFRDGISGRYFMANREKLIKLLEDMRNKATVGGVALALSMLGGMPIPSKAAIDYTNKRTFVDYEFVEMELDDGEQCIGINVIYK